MSTALLSASTAAAFIHSRRVDRPLVVAPLALGLATALTLYGVPAAFGVLLAVDLWLLGYHHVAATFTRLCFDRDSFRRYRLLVVVLPIGVLALTWLVTDLVGAWLVTTTYFYWQGWHYARQSYGVERLLGRSDSARNVSARLSSTLIYASSLFGVLYRSAQAPETFLNMSIRMPPVPEWLLLLAGSAFVTALVCWLWLQRDVSTWEGTQVYVASHVLMVVVGYLAFDTLEQGWLALNVWHNLQYLIVVWAFNNRRFSDAVHPVHVLLSRLSQRKNAWKYVVICLGFSCLLYTLLHVVDWVVALPVMFVASMGMNFHHYIVDSVIWRRPSRARAAIQGR